MCNSSLLNMAIEIVKFPIEHGDLAHSYVNVYQRVMVDNGTINIHWHPFFYHVQPEKPWLTMVILVIDDQKSQKSQKVPQNSKFYPLVN